MLTRPTDVSSIEDQRIVPRGSSGSSSSPYRVAAVDAEQQINAANERQDGIYTKKGGFTPNAAFNRFASDKNLLGL